MTEPSVQDDGGVYDTSSSLLQRARLREQAAWERLVDLYTPLVYYWCRKWGLQSSDSENLGQEVFVAVARNLPDFHRTGGTGSFRSWIKTIARNKFVDHVRANHSGLTGIGGSDIGNRMHLIADFNDASENDASEETKLLYERAVELIRGEFSERDWMAFVALVIEERTPAEVAEELSTTVNSVYLARSRILRRLRTEFADIIELK